MGAPREPQDHRMVDGPHHPAPGRRSRGLRRSLAAVWREPAPGHQDFDWAHGLGTAPAPEPVGGRALHPSLGAGGAGGSRPGAPERIDPADRAFLLQLYQDLVGGVEGPVVPFPVELVAGEDEAPELDELAEVVDLAAYRARRAAPAAGAESTGS